jgi:hypothetical protein
VENENRLRSNGVDFFRGEGTSQGMSTEDPYGLLVVDHGKLIHPREILILLTMNPLRHRISTINLAIAGPAFAGISSLYRRRQQRIHQKKYTTSSRAIHYAASTRWWRERSPGELYMKWRLPLQTVLPGLRSSL